MYKRVLLKLSGEALAADRGFGVDVAKLHEISLEILAVRDLGVEVANGVLTVTGKREGAAAPTYLHQGIAGRAFERKFQLAEHVEVRGAKLENGLLHVELERVVPEAKKPRKITINAPELKTIEGAKAA